MGTLDDLIRGQLRKMGRPVPPRPSSAPSAPSARDTGRLHDSLTPKRKSKRPDLERAWLTSWQLLGHPEPIRQYRFHPTRKFRFDFAWPDARVAVEIQGGIWSGGGHTRGRIYTRDRDKSASAQELGWLVYEVTDVKDTRLMDRIAGQIEMRTSRPRGRDGV